MSNPEYTLEIPRTTLLGGKVAIVTGGSRGIGGEIAKTFAYHGARAVVINSREESREAAEKVMEKVEFYGAKALWVPGSIEDIETSRTLVMQTMENFQHINILVNNAGITRDKLFLKLKPDDFDDVMNTNCRAAFFTTKQALRFMLAEDSASVICMSSVAAHGNPGQANYAVSKAGLEGLVKTLAIEYGKSSVRFNAIAPGLVDTKMADLLPEEQKQALIRQCPLGRIISPSEIANVALFLASPLSSTINGSVLAADGGMVR